MNQKIGFIGAGNMAKAMIRGLLNKDIIEAKDIFTSSKSSALDEDLSAKGVHHSFDNIEVVKNADIIVLAVKPHLYQGVIEEIKQINLKDKIFISIAAGKSISFLEEHLGSDKKILRTMPNTPITVGKGITALCPNNNLNEEELSYLKTLFESFGITIEIEEDLFDAVVAISGSSPAYIFMMIEAMADAGVLMGLSRNSAYELAANAMIGSAELMLESGKHPAVLKDMVTSPRGTTIEALRKFEEKGLRSALIEGMIACYEKSKNM